MSAPISLHPYQHLLLSVFFIIDIPMSRRWYLIMVLTCVSLVANNIEHFSMCICLLAICLSYLEKYLFRSFAYFKMGLSFYTWVVSFLYVFYVQVPYHGICDLKIFSLIQWAVFFFFDSILWSTKDLALSPIYLFFFFPLIFVLLVSYLRKHGLICITKI